MGFINNPYFGAVAFVSILCADPWVGLALLVGGGAATAAEMALRLQSEVKLRNGVSPFCACLYSTVMATIATEEELRGSTFWLCLVGGAMAWCETIENIMPPVL